MGELPPAIYSDVFGKTFMRSDQATVGMMWPMLSELHDEQHVFITAMTSPAISYLLGHFSS